MLNIVLSDIETIAVPDSALEENSNGDWEVCDSGVIELVEVVVTVGFVSESEGGQEMVVWVL